MVLTTILLFAQLFVVCGAADVITDHDQFLLGRIHVTNEKRMGQGSFGVVRPAVALDGTQKKLAVKLERAYQFLF